MAQTLITGDGMLGQALAAELERAGRPWAVLSRPAIDMADPATLAGAIRALAPGVILHTAALTKVNHCEQHPELAMLVNAAATATVVELAEELGARLIYFSTDYVFDGRKGSAYMEGDATGPCNAYGRSKLAGESHVAAYPKGHIVRTSGIFGSRRGAAERNFVRAIAGKLVSSTDEIPVVADQVTCLTYAPQLAALALAQANSEMPPLIHLTSAGVDSWCGWARRIAGLLGYAATRIVPINSADLGDFVARPEYSALGSRFPDYPGGVERLPAEAGLTEYLALLRSTTGGQY